MNNDSLNPISLIEDIKQRAHDAVQHHKSLDKEAMAFTLISIESLAAIFIRQHQAVQGDVVDYKIVMALVTAVHGMIGYCDLNPGTVVTEEWSERLQDHYIPLLKAAMAASESYASGDTSPRFATRKDAKPEAPANDSIGSPTRYTDGGVSREYEEQPSEIPVVEPVGGYDYWIIYFEDKGLESLYFSSEQSARNRYRELLGSWNCHLFRQVEWNGRKAPLPDGEQIGILIHDAIKTTLPKRQNVIRIYDAIRPYLATRKPVVVSLEKCAIPVRVGIAQAGQLFCTVETSKMIAEAVLESLKAQGVQFDVKD